MIRISLPWVIEIVRAVDALNHVTSTCTYGEIWAAAYSVQNHLDQLFVHSLYGGSLRSSRQPADELRKTLASVTEAEATAYVSGLVVWQIEQSKSQFRTIFLAELGVLPSYFVTTKPPFDINMLLEAGEHLMPNDLASKVPEAVFDSKEAGKALAFELGTSCGFHAFRCLEAVVRRYYKEIANGAAEPKQRNLGVYIRALEKANANKTIIAALQQLKDLHRNPLVHPQVAITLDEAISIIGMVRSIAASMLNEIPKMPQTTITANT